MVSKGNVEIAIVIGTRAELIKTFPVIRELKERNKDYYFIHTGQHNLGDLCKIFSVKNPDVVLTMEPERSSRFNSNKWKAMLWMTKIIRRIRKELKNLPNLKYVLYHGDTITTASAAISSSKIFNPFKKYKNVHLEAGLRSFDNFEPFPEEISRRIVGKFSDVLFTPSEDSKENLKRLKRKKKIKPLTKGKFALVTVHRHENLVSKERMEKIIEIINKIEIPTFFAVHDNTLHKIKNFGLLEKLNYSKNIRIIKPMDYISFIYQMSK